MKRLSFWQVLAIPFFFVPLMAQALTIETLGKHQRADGSIYDFKIQDGDALSPGDRFQITIEPTRPIYYSIIYFSRDGKATQLFPLAGSRKNISPGVKLFLPTKDNYFTLDTNGGRELMFIVTSPNPLSNLKLVLKGSETVGSSSQAIKQYLEKRLPEVAKLEITNTGGKVTGLADQVSSGLVRDISATYAANPWSASVSDEPDRRKRARRQADSSIPDAVRRRAVEVRALLKRPAGAPSSSSLRTTVAQKPASPEPSGKIRRDAPMLVDSREDRLAKERAEAERIARENKRLQEERVAQARAAEEIKRLERERETARLAAEERQRQEALAEAARIEAEDKRLEEERLVAALAEEEALRLEQERIAAQKAAAEASEIEQRQVELARAEAATKKLEAERIAAAQAATEIRRLEQERETARLAAEERRLQEERVEAERIALGNMRLEEERATAARAAAEIKRLEAEKAEALAEAEREAERQAAREAEQQQARLAAAEEVKPKEQEQEGFFGAIASLLGGGTSTDGDGSTNEVLEDSTGEPIDNAPEPVQPVVNAEPAAPPAEAVVVLQAPIRPQPPRMSAPAPTRAKVSQEQVATAGEMRQLYDQVASSIVSIRTINDAQASGFVLDNKGHILTSWHVINGVKDIDVRFAAIAGAQRSYKAQVIRQDKFRDLALLKLVNPPEGIQPITLASGPLPDAGTTVRVFGQKQGEIWATNDAVITRIAPNFTWFSTDNVIHRGEILQVDLPTRGKGIGALVTSMDYKMLGIKSFSGKETGRTYAVSVHNILDFLQPKK